MPEKVMKKKDAPKQPTYAAMIKTAIVSLKDRKGSSRQAIEKFIKANFAVGETMAGPLKLALKKGVEKGTILQVKGKGASGSFKIAKVEKVAKKPAAKKVVKKAPVKKAAAKKVTKKAPKPSAAAKKPAKKAAAKLAKKAPAKKAPAKKPAAKKAAPKPAAKKAKK